ncbi:MAG: DNA-directed RNA polymerase subunit beta, partial [Spirochaetia bacterium]|nr:DNA-directed RNA polymerase subunit beta [Spirochaetia bacterium]
MLASGKAIERMYVGAQVEEVLALPNLVDIQLSSYDKFLQRGKLITHEPLELQGLEEVFQSTFPIESPSGDMILEYVAYTLDEANIKFSEIECKQKGLSYSVPIKAKINLIFQETGEIRQKDIYVGDIPLMTDRGTFIINGAERVVVSQIHRSPGVIFSHEKGVYSSRIIPYRGSWLEFEIDHKKDLVYAKIDRKKRILGTLFLRALGYDSREKILELYYDSKKLSLAGLSDAANLNNIVLFKDIFINEGEERKKLYRAGDRVHPHEVDELIHSGVTEVEVIDMESENSLHAQTVLRCFEIEDAKHTRVEKGFDEPTKEDALVAVYSVLMPGEPITLESAEKDLNTMFFTYRRYDLGRVGRYKLNKKYDYDVPMEEPVLTKTDIVNTMSQLIKVYMGDANVDDIDHLGNRRIRSVGELMQNQLKTAFTRMERIAKERMNLETETVKPQDLISIKPVVAAIKEFFGSSQLSQFMDQINPLAELTHKRRLNALGPGGLSRDRAGFEVRDVHYTHYGRMCPIETPEGPNIGLIVSLANYTRVNDYGFLESPYRKVVNGKVTREIEYLSAIDEEKHFIAQANAEIDEEGNFLADQVSVRRSGDYITKDPAGISYMDVSPKQVISVATSLIPFLEHDDANRALMGSNMQRQAVPLVFPEPPRVGTGMEAKTAYDSGVLIKARRAGVVDYVTAEEVVIIPDEAADDQDRDVYTVQKYQRTNQDTCFTQKPIVSKGQHIALQQAIADGPSTYQGELALGRNV